MADQRREVSHQSPPPPPYADPLTILAPHRPIVNQVSPVVPSKSGLGIYFPSFLLFLFVSYMILQIVFACFFNCSLPNTNLGWIRASFFLNIPAVLILCICFIQNHKRKKIYSCNSFLITVLLYSGCFVCYLIIIGIYFEIDELKAIRKVLENTTITSLPCSTSYYENIFRLKLSQHIFVITSFLLGCFHICLCGCGCYARLKVMRASVKEQCIQFISPIINRWRLFIGTLCGRHQQETFIQRSERY